MVGSILDLFFIGRQFRDREKDVSPQKKISAMTYESETGCDDILVCMDDYVESNLVSFPFSGNGLYKVWERLDEQVCLFEENTGKMDFSQIHEGDDVSFESEPENPVDPNAVRIIIDGKFIGYLYQNSDVRRQVYKSNSDFENLKFMARISYVDRKKPELKIRFALYKRFNSANFELLGSYKLVKTSKNIGDYENRQDNYVFSGLDEDAIVQIKQDQDDEGNVIYIVYAPAGGEIGEIPVSASRKLEEAYPRIVIGIVEKVEETDFGKYVARIKYIIAKYLSSCLNVTVWGTI